MSRYRFTLQRLEGLRGFRVSGALGDWGLRPSWYTDYVGTTIPS